MTQMAFRRCYSHIQIMPIHHHTRVYTGPDSVAFHLLVILGKDTYVLGL